MLTVTNTKTYGGDTLTVYTEIINGCTAVTKKTTESKHCVTVTDANGKQVAYKQFARLTDALNWGERTIEDLSL